MALANVWPGRHKVIAEGFSLVCSCASRTTAQTGPLSGFTKERWRLLLFPPRTAIFLCCLCSSVKWDGNACFFFFCFFFLNETGSYANTVGKALKKRGSLFFCDLICGFFEDVYRTSGGHSLHPDIQSESLWRQSIVPTPSSFPFALKLSCGIVKHPKQQMGTIRVLNHGHYLSSQRFYFGILNLNCHPLNLTSPR